MRYDFVFSLGPGELSKKGLFLLRSIKRNTEAGNDEIYVFIAESEKSEIPKYILEEVETNASLIEDQLSIPEYPLSSAHVALEKASEASNKDYLLLLDTDTLVLSEPFKNVNLEKELYLKPVDVPGSYWGTEKSKEEWKQLYNKIDSEVPNNCVESTVGAKKMLPYYNGGMILTKNNDFPRKWLKLNKDLYGNLSRENYYTEQVCLALLASKYNVESVGEKYDFPLHIRFLLPSETQIVHYHQPHRVFTGINNKNFRKTLFHTKFIRNYGYRNILYCLVKDLIEKFRKRKSNFLPGYFS